VLDRVLSASSARLPFDWAALLVHEGSSAQIAAAWERTKDGSVETDDRVLRSPPASRAPRGAARRNPSADWGQPLARILADRGLQRLLYLPLGGSGSSLIFARRSAVPFRAGARSVLETIAGPLGAAFEAAGRERDLERRVEERTRARGPLRGEPRGGTTLTHDDLIRLVMEALFTLLDYDAGVACLDLARVQEISDPPGGGRGLARNPREALLAAAGSELSCTRARSRQATPAS